jgi:hypothetical protein
MPRVESARLMERPPPKGPPPRVRPALDCLDVEAAPGQHHGQERTGQPRADDGDFLRHQVPTASRNAVAKRCRS